MGDGDPSLILYGEDITPNEHKLALQFGVLDNFYDSGEVSGDGHLWSTASTTSDYNEKTWPIGYRSNERTYDSRRQRGRRISARAGNPRRGRARHRFPLGQPRPPQATYRIYGEFIAAVWCKSENANSPKMGSPKEDRRPPRLRPVQCRNQEGRSADPRTSAIRAVGRVPGPGRFRRSSACVPPKPRCATTTTRCFPDFETDYPDQLRADEFLREFDEFVKARGTAKELPQFILLYLPDDHTGGTRPGKPTPQASVADNDLALGRVVDAVSHSPYWDDTAIFVVEDDAQDGADHVDAHRSIAFVISKYSPRAPQPFVDHQLLHHRQHDPHDGSSARPATR